MKELALFRVKKDVVEKTTIILWLKKFTFSPIEIAAAPCKCLLKSLKTEVTNIFSIDTKNIQMIQKKFKTYDTRAACLSVIYFLGN